MSRVIITPLILLYSPIGIFLVLIRSLLLIYVFLASAVLYTVPPLKRVVLRLMCSFLGFVVTSEGNACGTSKQPFVSNCATLFDHMVLSLLTNCVTPHKFMLSWALTWRPLNYDESDCINTISDVFHIQPEETPTGPHLPFILKFNPAPFRLFNTVQPVAISVSTSLPIHMSVHPIDWKYEIFWLLFSPLVRVHVKFMTPMKKCADSTKSDELFADSVRHEIAKNLNKRTVDWDKNRCPVVIERTTAIADASSKVMARDERVGDHTVESTEPSCNNKETNNCNKQHISKSDPRIEQVLAVIPDANRQNVEKLLHEMDDVDGVIARLLEPVDGSGGWAGARVSSTPSTTASTAPITTTNQSSPIITTHKYIPPSCHRLAADTFSRNTDDRHRSFTERKSLFLENARHRYLEVHPRVNGGV